jgi:hypothetical protein
MSVFTELDDGIRDGDVEQVASVLDRNGLHCTVEDPEEISALVLKTAVIEEYGEVFYDPEFGPTWRVEQVGDTAIEDAELMGDLIRLIDEAGK